MSTPVVSSVDTRSLEGIQQQILELPIDEQQTLLAWLKRLVETDQGCGLLTPRQREVLHLVGAGRSNKEIANELKVSIKTVDYHKAQIFERLGLHNSRELVRYAVEHGMAPTKKSDPPQPAARTRGHFFVAHGWKFAERKGFGELSHASRFLTKYLAEYVHAAKDSKKG